MLTKLVAIVKTTIDVINLYIDEIRQIIQKQPSPAVKIQNPNFYKKNHTMTEMPEEENMPHLQDVDYEDDGDYESDRIVFMYNTETNDTLPVRFSGDEWKMLHEIAKQSGEHPKEVLEDIVLNRLEMLAEAIYNDINDEFPE